MHRLKKIGLVDELVEFKGNMAKYSREQECDKRNEGIELLKQRGCTHYCNIDSDEFYDTEQFKYAKKMINKYGWGITYWSYINYVFDFSHYIVYPFKPYVNGINSTFFKFTFNDAGNGKPTDPTRRVHSPTGLGCHTFESGITMAHAAWVRKDIRKKLENWSAKDFFPKELITKAVNVYENWKENPDGSCPNITMLFNVPGNECYVRKLDKPIHNIHVPWLHEISERIKTKETN
jgi:hypothetical protein